MKKVEILFSAQSPWQGIVRDFLGDGDLHLHEYRAAAEVKASADLILLEACQLSLQLVQKVKVARQINPAMRVFALGEPETNYKNIFDAVCMELSDLTVFTKVVAGCLPAPESIRLLIADDDVDILNMVCDYFEGRHAPAFDVMRAVNGREAWEIIQKKQQDILVLDVKMPVMTGSELYCKLQKHNKKIPTIIFFDAISAGDLNAVKKAGKPVIVEKGYRESSMPYLMALVKKLIYFSDPSPVN